MLEFIQLLNQRYQAIIANLKANDPQLVLFQQRLEQLLFTEAFMRKGGLLESSPQTPLQIAVIGPTQAGKSSIANLILNSNIAGVSPLAGYTVHPQGFCHKVSLQDCSGLQNYFGRFQQLNLTELSKQRHDCYSLTEIEMDSDLLPACVFWDTPDFDSIDSADYREGVIRTIALADIVVLIVSKEKYADQAVWEMMSSIESFHQTTLICVNKLIEGTEDIILNSLKQKWYQAREDEFPAVIPLHFQKQTAMPVWPVAEMNRIFQLQKTVSQQKHFEYQHSLLNKYWHSWVEPIVAEHEALRLWNDLVDKSIEQALEAYQRDYLNHPHYYDTFQNALIELLNLLEVPGISRVLTKTRRVLTWPVRKLMKLGKQVTAPKNQEQALLNQIGEHLLISLADQLLEKIDSDTKQNKWWKDSYCLLRQQRNELLNDYQQVVDSYCSSFQQDVEATANKLYNKLSEQPIVLNSLRATRLTTDAAAMALMIQTGGIGVHDLVITPALLSMTSLLAESAIGGYMGNVEAELKLHQLETVKKDLFIATLQQSLSTLPEQLTGHSRFNISIERLKKAEQQRNEKKHGIRLL
ncbi:MAG: GTP-binding protein [Methylococcaceae bacterium]|nr:GTP-binding protein [Methylococcaceae bacterium]